MKEDYIQLKEQLFLSQFTRAERQVFEFALDQRSVHETAKILHKEEETIKKIRRKILRKLEVSSMKSAIELYEKVAHRGTPTSSFFNDERVKNVCVFRKSWGDVEETS
ncbi:LuxR C-terminal-related transcriptional regulator [Priestia endophytica]|uniref:LuxR C-terminal-related transcriptional regulator n=1 Tax=Priestia endophytica TaxID=135735 RepID=UPI0038504620